MIDTEIQVRPPVVMRPLTLDELRARTVVSVEEAGSVLDLSRSSAYLAAKRGELPTIRLGRKLVVPVVPLLRLLGLDQDREAV
jgi:hypothetical protein